MTRDETILKVDVDGSIYIAEKCKRSFYYFVQTFWSAIIEEDPVWNFHIKVMCDVLQEYGQRVKKREPKKADLIINVPPGCSKSTVCTIMFPVWLWTIDPSIRVMTGSYSSTLAIDHSVKSRDVIYSPLFGELFPEIRLKGDKNNKSNYQNASKGERYAAGINGTIAGFHAHVIIIDDPLNPQQSNSPDLRDAANNFFSKTLSTRKVDKRLTPIILIMQRLHQNDPTGYLLSKLDKKIEHIKLPASLVKTNPVPLSLLDKYVDGLLDPVRMGKDILTDMKIDLGSINYANQFDQEPGDEEGGTFKKSWFKIVDIENCPSELFNQVVYFNADTATKISDSNDPSGILTYIPYANDIYLFDWVNKRLEFPELCDEMKKTVETFGTNRSITYVEPKSSGTSLVQQIKRTTKLNIVEYQMTDGDKMARANLITPYCEAGRVILVKGNWNTEFLEQLSLFPNATHDEAVDNITMAVTQHIYKSGIKASGRSFKKIN